MRSFVHPEMPSVSAAAHFNKKPTDSTSNRFSHGFYDCPKRCTRSLPCGHPCVEVCSAECKANCICDDNGVDEEVNDEEILAVRHQKSSSNHPSGAPVNGHPQEPRWDFSKWTNPRPGEFSVHAKAYNDFAQGGHVESDRALVTRAKEEAAKKVREKQDMDQLDALFGDPSKLSQVEKKKDGPKVLRVATDEHGATRTLYRETYTTAEPEMNISVIKKENIDLLDL